MPADWIMRTQLATRFQLRSALAPEDCARLIADLDKPKANFARDACCTASIQPSTEQSHQFSVERMRRNRRYWFTPVRLDGVLHKDGEDTVITGDMKVCWHDLTTIIGVLVFFGAMIYVLVANVLPEDGLLPWQNLTLIIMLLILLALYLGYRFSRLRTDCQELLTQLESTLHAKTQ